MIFTTRSLSSSEEREHNSIRDAITSRAGDIISWPEIEHCCCLDVDDGLIPFALIQPAPSLAWVSRSGEGFHAVYTYQDRYRADELAALAAFGLRKRYPQLHRFELLKHTFRPPGQWQEFRQSTEMREIDRMLGKGEPDQDAADAWLTSRGMEVGRRYPHSQCPIEPSADPKRDPVVVYPHGIYCHVCAANGHGWYRFGRESINTDLAAVVRNKTHWEHARYVLRAETQLPDELNRRIYSAALVHVHGNEVREERVFFPRRNFIRLGRWWATESGEPYNNNIAALVSSLPTCRYLDDKGKSKINREMVERLMQTIDLAEFGYPSIVAIRGCEIFGRYLQARQAYSIVVQNELLGRRENATYRPQYVGVDSRDVDDAWRELETPFPGLTQRVVELLVAARGVAEGEIGLPPMLYFSGPSGAAKTSSVLVAAAICGDNNTSVVWTNNIERVRQGILGGKLKGSFVTLNEILKQAKKAGVQFQCAMDDILNLTPDSVSHQMYIGPVPLGQLPVLIWTDTDVPAEIRDSVQLARRLIHVHLPRKVEWVKSIYESGVEQIQKLRLRYSAACNAILSDIIDRFFQSPNDIESIATSLGFRSLYEEGVTTNTDILAEFFVIVCDAPQYHDKRFAGEGWKLIELHRSETPIGAAWSALQDAENPRTSRRCTEANWPAILRVNRPVEFESQHFGSRLVVRFVSRNGDGIRFNKGVLQ